MKAPSRIGPFARGLETSGTACFPYRWWDGKAVGNDLDKREYPGDSGKDTVRTAAPGILGEIGLRRKTRVPSLRASCNHSPSGKIPSSSMRRVSVACWERLSWPAASPARSTDSIRPARIAAFCPSRTAWGGQAQTTYYAEDCQSEQEDAGVPGRQFETDGKTSHRGRVALSM